MSEEIQSANKCLKNIVLDYLLEKPNDIFTTQKQEKKEEFLNKKMKRSPDERHIQTHGSLIKTFQQS